MSKHGVQSSAARALLRKIDRRLGELARMQEHLAAYGQEAAELEGLDEWTDGQEARAGELRTLLASFGVDW